MLVNLFGYWQTTLVEIIARSRESMVPLIAAVDFASRMQCFHFKDNRHHGNQEQ